jgi:hypothetical protein
MLLNFFAAAVLAAVRVTAAPEKHLAAREICTPDDCYRAVSGFHSYRLSDFGSTRTLG